MGVHLADILCVSGHDLYITSRDARPNRDNIHYICGNAHNEDFIADLLQHDWDVIVDFMVYDTDEISKRVNSFLAAAEQYVFLSSARVYADSELPLTEKSPRILDVCQDRTYLATHEYALAKARQENLLFNNSRQNWTIVRPYITFSEYRLQLGVLEKEEWLYRALHGRPIVFSQDIASRRTTLTYGHDVSRGIAALLGQATAHGEAFHITTDETHTWDEILSVYLRVLSQTTGKNVESFLTEHSLNLNWNKYQVTYDRCFNRVFDNQKICRFIDAKSFTSTLTGLETCLTAFLNKPQFKNINYAKEAMFDKTCHRFMSFGEFGNLHNLASYLLHRTIR